MSKPVIAADLPTILPGRHIELEAAEWIGTNEEPAAQPLIVIAELVHIAGHEDDDRVWVTGHQLSCVQADSHPPCVEVQVLVSALARQATPAAVAASLVAKARQTLAEHWPTISQGQCPTCETVGCSPLREAVDLLDDLDPYPPCRRVLSALRAGNASSVSYTAVRTLSGQPMPVLLAAQRQLDVVPPGLVCRLEPYEYRDGVSPLTIVVAAADEPDAMDQMTLTGHTPRCGTDHPPCMTLRQVDAHPVRTAVLRHYLTASPRTSDVT